VTYRRLGLAVIDEQHRFGVAQRMMLTAKAERPPHLLVMTATPIPRTLTLTQYGEMDVSRLDEMPPGRSRSRRGCSRASDSRGRGRARPAYRAGQAGLLGVPSVEESEASDLAAARSASACSSCGSAAIRPGPRPHEGPGKGRRHGAFQAGQIKVLVATVVIEVGVDVPNAT
jgi:ATP-dependent DNA helicase RecG